MLHSVEDAAMINANNEKSNDENPISQTPASSVSQSSTFDQIALRFINSTNAAIVKFKWVLLIAVIAMIGANIGILIYIVDDVTHTDSLETFNHLGQIMFYIGSVADLSRSIDIELSSGKYNLTRDLEYLENDIKALNALQNTILDDKSMWNYCPSSEIVLKNIIPIWEFNKNIATLKKYNLYDVVSKFIENEQGLLKDARSKNMEYIDHIRWLMINSLSFSYHYIEKALLDLVYCEKNRVEETGIKINVLLLLGIIILGICLGVLIFFIVSFRVAYEKFWSFIKKSVVSNYILIKQAALDRLVSVHGIDVGQDNNFLQKPTNSKNFHIKTTLAWKFSWRLSFFAIVSLSFYLLTMLYLYKTCKFYMIHRPKLLQNINVRRSLLSRIGFYARDMNFAVNKRYFPNSYSFANSSLEFYNLVNRYISESNQLRSHDLSVLLSHKLKVNFYESTNYSADFLDFGTKTAINIFMFDAYNIGGPGGIRPDKEISDFIANFTVLQDALADVFYMADSSSKQVISEQLNLMIWITIIFSAGLALLYLFYYLPFIKTQNDFLRKITILPKMIYRK
ncbi:unnamed protein product [Blepharisma stoltei]|uniref:Uncharacterized protein n=1 Tax=Blepharisma stoltei TaxID=1481888 RepID=A0AAU9JN36_9CILI|nr:unnamed protein product [Blepharisma stoltei]